MRILTTVKNGSPVPPKPSPSTVALLLIPLFLLALIFLFLFPVELRLSTCRRRADFLISDVITIAPPAPPPSDFRLLIGVLTRADLYERRQFIRLANSLQPHPSSFSASIDIHFVFCSLYKEDQRTLVAMEILRYDDIIILNCTENMNDGKTYAFFSSLPSLFNASRRPYDYVMKADDDTYLRLPQLAGSLRRQPRDDLYYGFVIPCESTDPFRDYMSGMGYVLSWDLVEWISASEIPRRMKDGPEDLMVGEWFKEGGKAKNRFTPKPAMYNYPDPGDPCAHEFVADTIAVHRLKDNPLWAETLKYFNVAGGLHPSTFYTIT
ncbi:putative beta-1,3-galactosyltransferase 16 [Platanthera guangdongensis]|uniref:Hexosyltransferase n=1 Tax=Platanthera guangdongensis TaxID=2320717 RepID=A0ABR2LX29_9ASPA